MSIPPVTRVTWPQTHRMARTGFLSPEDIAAPDDWKHILTAVAKTGFLPRLKDSLARPDKICEEMLDDHRDVTLLAFLSRGPDTVE